MHLRSRLKHHGNNTLPYGSAVQPRVFKLLSLHSQSQRLNLVVWGGILPHTVKFLRKLASPFLKEASTGIPSSQLPTPDHNIVIAVWAAQTPQLSHTTAEGPETLLHKPPSYSTVSCTWFTRVAHKKVSLGPMMQDPGAALGRLRRIRGSSSRR